MEMPVLAVDLDGVVADFMKALQWRGKAYGLDIPVPRDYYFAECNAEIKAFLEYTFRDYTFYEGMPLLPGAARALDKLALTYRLVAVTARSWNPVLRLHSTLLQNVTRAWIEQRCLPFTNTLFVASGLKADAVKTLYPDCAAGIDDNPDVCRAYLGAGMKSYLVDWLYNRGAVPGVRRVLTLESAAAYEF